VVEVRHKSDRIMAIKVLVGLVFVNVVSVCAPQISLPDDIKKLFWEDLDMVIQNIPQSEKLFIGDDFNGHIGADLDGYDAVHGGFGFGERYTGGFLYWTLRWPMNYWWSTPISRRRTIT